MIDIVCDVSDLLGQEFFSDCDDFVEAMVFMGHCGRSESTQNDTKKRDVDPSAIEEARKLIADGKSKRRLRNNLVCLNLL